MKDSRLARIKRIAAERREARLKKILAVKISRPFRPYTEASPVEEKER